MASQSAFTGRRQELLRLTSYLDRALGGRGQVCLVTGEAGRGKTALALEFARLAQEARPDLIFAAGACDCITGRGDPYHPFRAILQTLTGAGRTHTVQRGQTARLRRLTEHATAYMLDWGRELFDVFLPSTRARATGCTVGDLDLRQILPPALLFQQYTNVLHRLAEKAPLLLLVDDVQWADRSSLALLLHLVQRLAGSRIMLIITLPDVAGVEMHHPLRTVLATVQETYGDAVIDLALSDGRAWVDAYVDSLPNRLEGPFRHALFRQTNGNPLAVVELVQIMQEQGVLVQDDYGAWLAPAIVPWAQLPGCAEAVVQALLDRLPLAVRQTLQVASVQGQAFIAEAAAEVQGVDTATVLEHLNHQLVQRHHLLEPVRRARINGRKLAHFAFTHHVYVQQILSSVPPSQRTSLHAATAQALAELLGAEAQTFEGALALTWHMTRGGLLAEAQAGLRLLGEQAAA